MASTLVPVKPPNFRLILFADLRPCYVVYVGDWVRYAALAGRGGYEDFEEVRVHGWGVGLHIYTLKETISLIMVQQFLHSKYNKRKTFNQANMCTYVVK